MSLLTAIAVSLVLLPILVHAVISGFHAIANVGGSGAVGQIQTIALSGFAMEPRLDAPPL